MAAQSKTVQMTKRQVWEGSEALAGLANQQWKSTSVALAIGRTYRRLQAVRDEIDKDRQVILAQYAVKAEDGSYEHLPTGQVKLSDSVTFNKEWAELLAADAAVEIYPFKLSALTANGKKKKCGECQRPMGAQLTAYQLDLLAELGVLIVDDDADEDEK